MYTGFVVIDVETANPELSSICSIGVVGFLNEREVFADYKLIDPRAEFSAMNISIHGISAEQVAGSATFLDAHEWLEGHLQGKIVVSHSAFDRCAVARASAKVGLPTPACNWLDTLRVARRAWPELKPKGYGLARLASVFGIPLQHHDALQDARACGLIMLRAIQDSGLDLAHWAERVLKPISPPPGTLQPPAADGPLSGQVVVVTGTLSRPRRVIAEMLAGAGAEVDAGVTHDTTMLIVGSQDWTRLNGKDKSSKHLKAEALIGSGYPIRIVSEADLDCLAA